MDGCSSSDPDFAAVVLAAGQGTRMKSDVPKVLHKICGRELLSLVIDASAFAGIGQLAVVVPKDHKSFLETTKGRAKLSIQQTAEGSGHALMAAREHVHLYRNVIVLNGDIPLISPSTIQNMLRNHTEKEAIITVLVCEVPDPKGLGRIIRDDKGNIISIVEEVETDQSNRHTPEVNAGIYCFKNNWLWKVINDLKPSSNGEIYITDLIALAHKQGLNIQSVTTLDQNEIKGVNNKVELSDMENIMKKNICEELMLEGVIIIDPTSTYIDHGVKLGKDSVIHPNCHIRGATNIGMRTTVGPNTIIQDSQIGDDCNIFNSVVDQTKIGDRVEIGPFSHTRSGTKLHNEVHIGNHAEIKNSTLGRGTKMGHFSYIGDADIGANVNIGAGTITCNYDGIKKNRTIISDEAFIGSDTMLIAPVKVGYKSRTGAGSVISKDVPDNSKAIGSPARILRDDQR